MNLNNSSTLVSQNFPVIHNSAYGNLEFNILEDQPRIYDSQFFPSGESGTGSRMIGNCSVLSRRLQALDNEYLWEGESEEKMFEDIVASTSPSHYIPHSIRKQAEIDNYYSREFYRDRRLEVEDVEMEEGGARQVRLFSDRPGEECCRQGFDEDMDKMCLDSTFVSNLLDGNTT